MWANRNGEMVEGGGGTGGTAPDVYQHGMHIQNVLLIYVLFAMVGVEVRWDAKRRHGDAVGVGVEARPQKTANEILVANCSINNCWRQSFSGCAHARWWCRQPPGQKRTSPTLFHFYLFCLTSSGSISVALSFHHPVVWMLPQLIIIVVVGDGDDGIAPAAAGENTMALPLSARFEEDGWGPTFCTVFGIVFNGGWEWYGGAVSNACSS